MSEPIGEKPIKKIADAASQVARVESASVPVRQYRTLLFRIILIFVAGAFAGLTFLVKTIPSFAIDIQITTAIQRINLPAFALLMRLISWPGFSPQSFIFAALLIVLIYVFGLHWEAVMAFIAAVLSTAIDVLLKDLIQRPRPLPDQVNVFAILSSYSFPSGHVMYYVCFFGFIGFLTFTLLKPSLNRSLLLLFLGSLVALVGVSRVFLGQHWTSDVLGSYLLGSLTLVGLIQYYLWGKTRFFVHQPLAEPEPQKT
jgi:membrane-associated phospholipid phosphatase